jgi:monothiol glutaredoxin
MPEDIDITPTQAVAKLQDPAVKLLDVREDWERDICQISGSIQLTEELAEEIIANWPKDTEIVFQCHHGGRSASAAYYFIQHGFDKVYNLAGGIDAWSREIDANLARY